MLVLFLLIILLEMCSLLALENAVLVFAFLENSKFGKKFTQNLQNHGENKEPTVRP